MFQFLFSNGQGCSVPSTTLIGWFKYVTTSDNDTMTVVFFVSIILITSRIGPVPFIKWGGLYCSFFYWFIQFKSINVSIATTFQVNWCWYVLYHLSITRMMMLRSVYLASAIINNDSIINSSGHILTMLMVLIMILLRPTSVDPSLFLLPIMIIIW